MIEKRIYLTGFMTSGKSTIGPILANSLGWDYYDLDREIEHRERKTVVEIFEKNGEEYFRKIETSILTNLSKDELVVSLGGGTIINNTNFEIIKNTGKTVYLKVSPQMIYKRIRNKLDRPLFRDLVLDKKPEKDFLERIENILNDRNKFYECSDIVIDTEQYRIGITIDNLVKKLIE